MLVLLEAGEPTRDMPGNQSLPSDEKTMPNITLTWQPYFIPTAPAYGVNAWILQLVWRRNDNNTMLQVTNGLYVISNVPAGGQQQLYAGQALNVRNRFNGRSEVLREYKLNPLAANVVLNYRVYVAKVNPGGAVARNLAEQWLVRILYLADVANAPRLFQNVNLTGPMTTPNDGIGLNITNVNPPPFLLPAYAYGPNVVI